MRRMFEVVKGLVALVVTILLVVGVPILLTSWSVERFAAVGDVIGDELASDAKLIETLLTAGLLVVFWLAWVMLVVAILTEAVALSRGRTARRLPVLPGIQVSAGRLVASIALIVSSFSATTPSVAAAPLVPLGVPGDVSSQLVQPMTTPPPATAPTPVPRIGPDYTVQHGDSWWSLADRFLGDGLRWREIVAANTGRDMVDGSRINEATQSPVVGWTIALPAGADVPDDLRRADAGSADVTHPARADDTAVGPSPHRYVVRPNDGMWDVAEGLLGDGTRHGELRERLIGQEVAAGVVFEDDTDVIHPGWTFELDEETRDELLADDVAAGVHVVEEGDTLSGIAELHLGDRDRWPELWEDNRGEDMGGGRSFDDPDLILPGWEIDVNPDDASVPPDLDIEARDAESAERADQGEPSVEQADASVDQGEPSVEQTDARVDEDEPGVEQADARVDEVVASLGEVGDTVVETGRSHDEAHADAVPEPVDFATPASIPTPTTTTTPTPTSAPLPADADGGDVRETRASIPAAPSPLRIEHAALLAAGVLSLVGVRRRQRLRSAGPRARVPQPSPDVVATERRLRTIDPGERAVRVDVSIRAAAAVLVDTDSQIGIVSVDLDGAIDVRLTRAATLPEPWSGGGSRWSLAASTPIEMIVESARHVGTPCVALVQIGVAGDRDVLVDLEACGSFAIEADAEQAEEVVAGVAAGLACSPYAEVAHLVTVSLPDAALLDHRNAHRAGSIDEAFRLAESLIGSTSTSERSTFALRSLRTGGEMWEPAAILLGRDDGVDGADAPVTTGGHGLAVVAAVGPDVWDDAPARLIAGHDGWTLVAFGSSTSLTPVGVTRAELGELVSMLADASEPLVAADETANEAPSDRSDPSAPTAATAATDPSHTSAPTAATDPSHTSAPTDPSDPSHPSAPADPAEATLAPEGAALAAAESSSTADSGSAPAVRPPRRPIGPDGEFSPMEHAIVVRLLGAVDVVSASGQPGEFERSKTVELIAWLATHRHRSTRTAARTALWELDVRDATFANVVSEARRALGRLVTPPPNEEWLARTLTEQLPLHDKVVTDAQLVEERLAEARLQPPSQAVVTLRPAAEMIRDLPFAGTSYLWPDAEGIVSNLVLLATGVASELAAHALSLGDTDLVFWATGQGLRVLPGHEELIGLRMRAHARAGDLAGVRHEWESYERVVVADAWSDGEPAPKLLALRHELLASHA